MAPAESNASEASPISRSEWIFLPLLSAPRGPNPSVVGVVVVAEEDEVALETGAMVEVDDDVLEERGFPVPKGAHFAFCFVKFVWISSAMKRHMPAGYAAVGETLKPPLSFLPTIFVLCRFSPVCPQLSGSGPM